MNPDEMILATLYLDIENEPESHRRLAVFAAQMRAAYALGHATRVEKMYEGSGFGTSPIQLYAVKQVAPEWTCGCGVLNNGLATDCRSCETTRPDPEALALLGQLRASLVESQTAKES